MWLYGKVGGGGICVIQRSNKGRGHRRILGSPPLKVKEGGKGGPTFPPKSKGGGQGVWNPASLDSDDVVPPSPKSKGRGHRGTVGSPKRI
jgi:hypothetical protein